MKQFLAELLLLALLIVGGWLWLFPAATEPAMPAVATDPTWADMAWQFSKVALSATPGLFVVALAVAILSAPFLLWRWLHNRHEVNKLRAQRPLPEGITHYTAPRLSTQMPRFTPTPVPEIVDVAQSAPPLPLSQWFPQLVNHPAHVLLLGGTGDGKSTIANALLAARAQTDQIVALDPHGEMNHWPIPNVIGVKRDFDAIEAGIANLYAEFERRGEESRNDPPLTIFLDEFPAIKAKKKDSVPLIIELVREARKYGMRLVILSTGGEVRTLGIEGEGSVRESFLFVNLGSFAQAVLPEAAQYQYPAVLTRGQSKGLGMSRLVDTTGMPGLAQASVDPTVVWQPTHLLETTTTRGLQNDAQEEKDRRRRIIELAEQGLKPTPIAIEVLGTDSGRNVRYVKTVLAEEGGYLNGV